MVHWGRVQRNKERNKEEWKREKNLGRNFNLGDNLCKYTDVKNYSNVGRCAIISTHFMSIYFKRLSHYYFLPDSLSAITLPKSHAVPTTIIHPAGNPSASGTSYYSPS